MVKYGVVVTDQPHNLQKNFWVLGTPKNMKKREKGLEREEMGKEKTDLYIFQILGEEGVKSELNLKDIITKINHSNVEHLISIFA